MSQHFLIWPWAGGSGWRILFMGTQARRECEPSDRDPGQGSKKKAEALSKALGSWGYPAGWGQMWAPASARAVGDSLSAGEREKEQMDMTVRRAKCCHPEKHRSYWSPSEAGSREASWRRGPQRAKTQEMGRSWPGQEGNGAFLVEGRAGERRLLMKCLTHLGASVFSSSVCLECQLRNTA